MNLNEIIRRFLHNAAIIVSSRIVFGFLNLATNALVAKFFGLTDFGILILLQAYARLFCDFIKLDTRQAVLSFGATLEEQKDDYGFRRLLGFALSVDIIFILAAISGAILFIPFAIDLFEWPKPVADFAPYFTLSILFMVQGTPNGVLRFINRIDILAWQFALNAIIRFVGALSVLLSGGTVTQLVLVWFAANVLSGLLPIVICFKELSSKKLLPVFDVKWREASTVFHRIWRFLTITSLSSILSIFYKGGTVMIAGILLGPASAATFQLAKQFSDAINKPTQILGPLISPELAKIAARKDWKLFRKLIKRQLVITFFVIVIVSAVLFSILGEIVNYIYGSEVLEFLLLFKLLISASLMKMMIFSFGPAVLAANKPNLILWLQIAAVSLYIITTAILFPIQEIYAFGYGFLLSQILYVILFSGLGVRLLNKRVNKQKNNANINT